MKRMGFCLVLLMAFILGLAQQSYAQDTALVIEGDNYGDIRLRNSLEKTVKAWLKEVQRKAAKSDVVFTPRFESVSNHLESGTGRLERYVRSLLYLKQLRREWNAKGLSVAQQVALLQHWQRYREIERLGVTGYSFEWPTAQFAGYYRAWLATNRSLLIPTSTKRQPIPAPDQEWLTDDEAGDSSSLAPVLPVAQATSAPVWSERSAASNPATTTNRHTSTKVRLTRPIRGSAVASAGFRSAA